MSGFLNINWLDLGKGALVALITSLLTGLLNILQTGAFPNLEGLKTIGLTALIAGIAYLCKNFLTNSQGEILKKG